MRYNGKKMYSDYSIYINQIRIIHFLKLFIEPNIL